MQIGKKTRVQDIRSVWKKENDFSDWLVTEDGMSLLSEELGIEVENLRREVRAGDYPCDIVGNLLGDEHHVVVIENQYGKTDHDHLGKLLTYAAVHKATTGIWISETISDDHRKVIDWLNENTPDNVNLYLVGLKLYRIGDSAVAPQLDVVCRPNYQDKPSSPSLSPAEVERRQWYKSTWIRVGLAVSERKPTFRLQKPQPQHWSSIALGRSGFSLSMLLNTRTKAIGVELYISAEWSDVAFRALEEQLDEIESDLGPLDWQPLEGKKSARIIMVAYIDPKDPDRQDEIDAWFAENVQRFYDVFKDRVARLEAP
jgi:hypothetical protein